MAELQERAYEVFHDLATGLYDRRTMWYRLAEEISRARRYRYPFSLMLISFDALGDPRLAGNVQKLAEILKRHTRSADILARYSEDTLVLLLPCTDELGALHLAERIRQLVQVTLTTPGLPDGPLPVWIGVTSTPEGYSGDKVALVEQVEWALRQAQQQGTAGHTVVVPAHRPVHPNKGAPA